MSYHEQFVRALGDFAFITEIRDHETSSTPLEKKRKRIEDAIKAERKEWNAGMQRFLSQNSPYYKDLLKLIIKPFDPKNENKLCIPVSTPMVTGLLCVSSKKAIPSGGLLEDRAAFAFNWINARHSKVLSSLKEGLGKSHSLSSLLAASELSEIQYDLTAKEFERELGFLRSQKNDGQVFHLILLAGLGTGDGARFSEALKEVFELYQSSDHPAPEVRMAEEIHLLMAATPDDFLKPVLLAAIEGVSKRLQPRLEMLKLLLQDLRELQKQLDSP